MAGLKREARLRADVPAIHVFPAGCTVKTWMPGTRPGMTRFFRAVVRLPHPEERALARVSKDERAPAFMVRDAQDALLTMRNERRR
jgi:hypothetical protein